MTLLGERLRSRHRHKAQPDFSLATVNIVLLLVFFFLITGTLVENEELAVDLAQTEDLPLEQLPRPLLLMKADRTWLLDGQSVALSTLAPAVDARLEEIGAQDRTLHLLPDRSLPANDVIEVLQSGELVDVDVRLVTLRVRASP